MFIALIMRILPCSTDYACVSTRPFPQVVRKSPGSSSSYGKVKRGSVEGGGARKEGILNSKQRLLQPATAAHAAAAPDRSSTGA